jgi:nucleoside-diphosphate-sugar epimerase
MDRPIVVPLSIDISQSLHTVHVYDVARAIIHTIQQHSSIKVNAPSIKIYPLADQERTTYMRLFNRMAQLFDMNVRMPSKRFSTIKNLLLGDEQKFKQVATAVWNDILKSGAVEASLLSPLLDSVAMSGQLTCDCTSEAFINDTGFELFVPRMSLLALKDTVREYQELQWWPLPDTSITDEDDTYVHDVILEESEQGSVNY